MRIPTVLVACGAGIATSTIVAQRVDGLLKQNGIRAVLQQCTIAEVSSLQHGANLIISTTLLPKTYEVPTIIATAYITGLQMEKLDQQILDLLKN